MKVAHVLRKYNPAEWGGTETAVQRLLDGLAASGVKSVVYCPGARGLPRKDPLGEAGHTVKRYHAFVPVSGIGEEQRQQLVTVGGNLMSLDLPWQLLCESRLSLIHTHALNRLGGIALALARLRRIPLVVTIHGGVLDLPEAVRENLLKPLRGGWEWGKLFGVLVRSRKLLALADALITCNGREAELLRKKYPNQRVMVQPHGVPARLFDQDQREWARQAYPEIEQKRLVLVPGRVDPIKNQAWLVEQLPRALKRFPDLFVVFAGACTDESYGKLLKKEIRNTGMEPRVLLVGGLPPGDRRLVGLFQCAELVVLPSRSETFGLVILESWAAGTPVLASRTSGACSLIREGQNGWFFDIGEPETFHAGFQEALENRDQARAYAEAGRKLVRDEFDTDLLSGRVKRLYEDLVNRGRR